MKKHLKALAATGSAVGMYLSTAVVSTVKAQYDVAVPTGYATNIGNLISFVLRVVLAVGALLVFGFLVLGGIEYITSGGEKGKTEAARNKITAAIVGLIILAASWAILNLALGFLGLSGLEGALQEVGDINETR
ncbi:hypothetical protein H3C66_00190 [Patescibacteria group bacterium]|nr:hypothetical protein [Patescibacteria group bacterium]